MKHLAFILLVTLMFASCKKENNGNGQGCGNNNNFESFAFGTAYGECAGNCATFYSISNKKIFPDDMQYYTGQLVFKTTALTNDKYLLAKQLIDNFPAYLKNNPDQTFGCPDCHDQGGIHIETKENGIVKTWHIDNEIDKQPIQIRAYIQQLLAVLGQI